MNLGEDYWVFIVDGIGVIKYCEFILIFVVYWNICKII